MKELLIKVVIPTAGRAKTMTSHKYVENSIVCVPAAELGIYKEHNPDVEYITHPDTVFGIGLKRQWIYDKFRNVFMMDDDLKGLSRLTMKAGESSKISPELAYWIIQNLGNVCSLMGSHLFGFNNYVVPEQYHGHNPFSLTGYINGCGLGLLESGISKLKFCPLIKTNNDFFICGLNAFHYRKTLIDRRYCMNQDSFANNLGGCADVRTNEVEKEDFELLKMYFGDAVNLKVEGLYRSKHAHSKSMHIPY